MSEDLLRESIPTVIESARHTLQHMLNVGEGMNPMLHIVFPDEVVLALVDTAPRLMGDSYVWGQAIREQYGRTPTAVFFISDTYQFHSRTADAAETEEAMRRYNAGEPLEVLFNEGVQGVSEGLHVVGMDGTGAMVLGMNAYVRGNPIIWDEPEILTEKATSTGAAGDLLRGLLGLVRDVRLPGL